MKKQSSERTKLKEQEGKHRMKGLNDNTCPTCKRSFTSKKWLDDHIKDCK